VAGPIPQQQVAEPVDEQHAGPVGGREAQRGNQPVVRLGGDVRQLDVQAARDRGHQVAQ
jgi:hypothetical protein